MGVLRKICVLVGLAMLAASCAPQEPTELRVGIVTSFTGDLADYGEAIDRSARLAVELIEESIERLDLADELSVAVFTEDDQTEATEGVAAATKLVDSDRVQVIIGSLASEVTIAIAESVTIPNGVVQISPASTSPAISDISDDGFLFRTVPSDALQGRVIAGAMAEAFGADATVNTGARNDAYGTGLADVFEAAWRDGRGTIGQSVRWNPEAPTFDTEAAQLASGEPDAWFVVDYPATWERFGPALVRAEGWDRERTYTADGLRSTELPASAGAEATDGIRGTAPTTEGAPAGAAFAELWEQRAADVQRQTFDGNAFDAVMVAFLAAVAAGSSDRQAIRDNLRRVSGSEGTAYTFEQLDEAIQALRDAEDINYEGVSGPLNLDLRGDPTAAVYEVWAFTDGQIVTTDSFEYVPD